MIRHRLSGHLELELAHAVHTGHRPGDPPPLDEGAPVPGCGCERCTGVPASARRPRRSPPAGEDDPLPVEAARRSPITDLARRLGLGEPEGRWGEPKVHCPFHDDSDPSLHLNPDDGLWFCFPCGFGGDGIELVRRVLDVKFSEAVRWIVDGGSPARSRDPRQREIAS